MDPHPHPNRAAAPIASSASAAAATSAGRSREGDEKGITLRVDLDPLIGPKRRAQDTAMLHQHPRVLLGAQLVQEPRRTLDIREQERHRAGREIGSHRNDHPPTKNPRPVKSEHPLLGDTKPDCYQSVGVAFKDAAPARKA